MVLISPYHKARSFKEARTLGRGWLTSIHISHSPDFCAKGQNLCQQTPLGPEVPLAMKKGPMVV